MSTSRSLAGLLGAVAAVVLALPPRADAACDLYQTIPDGRFRGPYTISSGTNDVAMRFMGVLGKSYSVEAIVENAPFNAVANPSFSLNWGPAASTCPVSNVAGLRRTESIDPSSDLSPTNYFRGSFTAPSSTTFYTFRIG